MNQSVSPNGALPESVYLNEILVDFRKCQIKRDGEWRVLEQQCINVLRSLLKNHGNAVTRRELIEDAWGAVIVSDNSLTQAITLLRKALGDDPVRPSYIRTVPKVGYELIANTRSGEADLQKESKAEKIHFKLSKLQIAASISFVVLVCMAFAYHFFVVDKAKTHFDYRFKARLTFETGNESHIRFSPDGRFLMYSRTSDDKRHLDLIVKDIESKTNYTIESTNANEMAGDWSPDGKWLAYVQKNDAKCIIKLANVDRFTSRWQQFELESLAICDPNIRTPQMRWATPNDLYIVRQGNDRNSLVRLIVDMEAPAKLVSMELVGSYSPLLFDIDASNEHMLIQQRVGASYQLSYVNLKTSKETLLNESPYRFHGLKWFEPGKTYLLGGAKLNLNNLKGETKVIYPTSRFIKWIDYHPGSGHIAFSEGGVDLNLYTLDIKAKDNRFVTGVVSAIAPSSGHDYLPALTDDGKTLAFISSRSSKFSVWIQQQREEPRIIMELPQDFRPYYLIWSPSNEDLLLSDNTKKVYMLNIFTGALKELIANDADILNVYWSKDGKSIFYRVDAGESGEIWNYDLPKSMNSKLDMTKLAELAQSFNRYNEKCPIDMQISPGGFPNFEGIPQTDLPKYFQRFSSSCTNNGFFHIEYENKNLNLYLSNQQEEKHQYLQTIGVYENDGYAPLNVTSSLDGSRVIYTQPENFDSGVLHLVPTR